MSEQGKIQWRVPLRCQVEEAKREISRVLSPAVLIRIAIAVVVIFLAAAYLLAKIIPDLEFDWLAAFLRRSLLTR